MSTPVQIATTLRVFRQLLNEFTDEIHQRRKEVIFILTNHFN